LQDDPQHIAELADCPVVIQLPVQWGDQDAMGHVNNAAYFRWFESSRIAYLERVNLAEKRSKGGVGPILAAIGCNYRRQLRYPDTIWLGCRTVRIGRASLVLENKLWSKAHQALAADGQSTLVVFDYKAQRPTPVPDALREAIARLEGKVVEEFARTQE
jgi:acyl-CoA thioester hydrolase